MKNTALSAKKENISFKNDSHREFYDEWMPKCRCQDVYHKALVYCLGISEDTRNHVHAIYDFKNGCVKTECLTDGMVFIWNKIIRPCIASISSGQNSGI